MKILGIESTCDETAASVVEDGTRVLSNAVATQVDLHAKYRGVVPEIASRAHIQNILPVLKEALEKSQTKLEELDAIAIAHRPGLIGSLLIGLTAAKTLAWSINKPLIGIDHVQAHLYSVMLTECEPPSPNSEPGTRNSQLPSPPLSEFRIQNSEFPPTFPAIGLVCSGGHTALYLLQDWLTITLIGTTIDDAVGEAYDKVAALLGLPYPGGPVIDRLAAKGNPTAINFPRSLLAKDSLDFSFSGLKTAVLYNVQGVPAKHTSPKSNPTQRPPLDEQRQADIAASFQAACIDVILKKLKRALAQTNAKSILVGGGVSANQALRAALKTLPIPTHTPQQQYCTDNAAMTAGLAALYLRKGITSPLDLDAVTYSQFRE